MAPAERWVTSARSVLTSRPHQSPATRPACLPTPRPAVQMACTHCSYRGQGQFLPPHSGIVLAGAFAARPVPPELPCCHAIQFETVTARLESSARIMLPNIPTAWASTCNVFQRVLTRHSDAQPWCSRPALLILCSRWRGAWVRAGPLVARLPSHLLHAPWRQLQLPRCGSGLPLPPLPPPPAQRCTALGAHSLLPPAAA